MLVDEAINQVTTTELKKAVDNLQARAHLVIQENGDVFSHLMRLPSTCLFQSFLYFLENSLNDNLIRLKT